MKVTTAQWVADYDEQKNQWASRDGTIERFLNGHCLPQQGDAMDALSMVQQEFAALEPKVEEEQDEAQPE